MKEFRRFTPWWTTTLALGQTVVSVLAISADSSSARNVVRVLAALGIGGLAFVHWRSAIVRVSSERIESGSGFRFPRTGADVADLVAVRWENPKAISFTERLSGGPFVLDLGGLTRRQRDEIRALLRDYVPAYREARSSRGRSRRDP